MTNSPNTVSGWARLIIDIARILQLMVLLGLVIVLMSGGLSQLYLDFNTLEQDDLDGLIPTLNEIEQAWDVHQEVLVETHIPATMWATLTGFSLAIGVGLFLAALMDLIPLLRWILMPFLVITQTIPTFALAVLLILIFGFGFGPKIVVVVLFCFFPITVSTLNGLQNVDKVHMHLLRSMGANPFQTWWKVRLPTAMPSFFSGLRLAATYSVVGAVIGEYVGAGDGLGKFLQRSARSFKSDQVFLSVIIIAGLSVVMVLTISLIEILALKWRYIGQNRDISSLVRRFVAYIQSFREIKHEVS